MNHVFILGMMVGLVLSGTITITVQWVFNKTKERKKDAS